MALCDGHMNSISTGHAMRATGIHIVIPPFELVVHLRAQNNQTLWCRLIISRAIHWMRLLGYKERMGESASPTSTRRVCATTVCKWTVVKRFFN